MLYSALRQNQRLAEKRHPLFEKNRYAKIITYVFIAFWLAYLLLLGILIPQVIKEEMPGIPPYHLFNRGMIYLLTLDFLLRFIYQKIPTQEIKPYLLFPIPKKRLIHFFLLRSGANGYNLVWFFLLIPFAMIAILPYHGMIGVTGFLFGYYLLFMANNYGYLYCRTLINEQTGYLLLPICFYGGWLVTDLFYPSGLQDSFTRQLGDGFIQWNGLCLGVPMAIVIVLYGINLRLQQNYIYKELAKTKERDLRHISTYGFLDHWGEIGEYMRLEIKLHTRNKAVRTQFRTGLLVMLAFSMLLSFTPVYDDGFMTNFICAYNYAALGIMTLTNIMSMEGNYLDGLMSRKESILTLLKAKYYVNLALLLLPALLTLPAIATGKITVLTSLSYLFLTAGPLFALLFQLAVYNNRTFRLNEQITGKNGIKNYLQSLVSTAAFLTPILLNYIFCGWLGETAGCTTLSIIGIFFILIHPWWLKSIYMRFMKRRYINMDRFRNTR